MKRTLKVNHKLVPFLTKPQPIKVAFGGRGCVGGGTIIDTPNGGVRIDEFKGGDIYSLTLKGVSVVQAETPIKYPKEQLYRVDFNSGHSLECTDQHRFLTSDGWRSLSSLRHERPGQSCFYLHHSTLDSALLKSPSSVRHCLQRLSGFLYCYFWDLHRYDQQLPDSPDTFLSVFQQLTDEQLHNSHALRSLGDLEFWNTHSPSQLSHLLSSLVALLSEEAQNCEALGNCNAERFSELLLEISRLSELFHERINLGLQAQRLSELILDLYKVSRSLGGSFRTAFDILSCGVGDKSYSNLLSGVSFTDYTTIESIVATSTTYYYDLFVPIFNNYFSHGVVNHNSGKSIGMGDLFTFKMDTETADVYCLREFQESITDSVHKVFKSSINKRLQLEGWDIQQNTVIAPNGAKTTYKGANRNPDAMQSAHDYKYSWFEEAHRASQISIDKLLPTIIRNPGAECWFSANPQSSTDPFSKRFIVPYLKEINEKGFYEDELHYIVKLNWRDNPWWNKEQEMLRAWDYEHMERAKYDWIWEGAFDDSVENSLILAKWFDACVDSHKKLKFDNFGMKFAAHDPSDLGPDAKSYVLREGSIIRKAELKKTGDVNDGCDWAIDNTLMDRADHFTWDAIGEGSGLKRQVSRVLDPRKIDWALFKGSEKPDNPDAPFDDPDQYQTDPDKVRTNAQSLKNKRAQYAWKLRNRCFNTYQAVEKGRWSNPEDLISFDSGGIKEMDLLRSEICKIARKPNDNGLIQLISKKDMDESPNLFDGVCMSLLVPDIKNTKPIKQQRPW